MADPNPELRQTPTVQAGIVLVEGAHHDSSEPLKAPAVTIIYEPGNGSRYVLHFSPLQPSEKLRAQLGWDGKSERWRRWSWSATVVADLLQGTATVIHRGVAIDPVRLAKELHRSQIDGVVLAELLAYVLGAQETP